MRSSVSSGSGGEGGEGEGGEGEGGEGEGGDGESPAIFFLAALIGGCTVTYG